MHRSRSTHLVYGLSGMRRPRRDDHHVTSLLRELENPEGTESHVVFLCAFLLLLQHVYHYKEAHKYVRMGKRKETESDRARCVFLYKSYVSVCECD